MTDSTTWHGLKIENEALRSMAKALREAGPKGIRYRDFDWGVSPVQVSRVIAYLLDLGAVELPWGSDVIRVANRADTDAKCSGGIFRPDGNEKHACENCGKTWEEH